MQDSLSSVNGSTFYHSLGWQASRPHSGNKDGQVSFNDYLLRWFFYHRHFLLDDVQSLAQLLIDGSNLFLKFLCQGGCDRRCRGSCIMQPGFGIAQRPVDQMMGILNVWVCRSRLLDGWMDHWDVFHAIYHLEAGIARVIRYGFAHIRHSLCKSSNILDCISFTSYHLLSKRHISYLAILKIKI